MPGVEPTSRQPMLPRDDSSDDCLTWEPAAPPPRAAAQKPTATADPAATCSTFAGDSRRVFNNGVVVAPEGVDEVITPVLGEDVEEEDGFGEADRKSTCVAIVTMLLSIPALIGAWCWPLVLAGLIPSLGNINTGPMRAFSHSLTWGINLAVMTNMFQFAWKKCSASKRRSKKGHCGQFAPAYMLILATLLIMCDYTRHLLNDNWSTVCDDDVSGLPSKYSEACYSVPFLNMEDADGNLTAVGLWSSVIFMWTGFVLMFISIFWAIDFPRKMQKQWRKIQRDRQRGQARPVQSV